MSGEAISAVIRENSDVLVAAVQARMIHDATVVDMAAARSADSGEMLANIVGFWLEGITTDLALDSTAATEQSLSWLARMRAGQDVRFDDQMVVRMFEDISAEIMTCLADDGLEQEYRGYRARVLGLIGAAFPGAVLPS